MTRTGAGNKDFHWRLIEYREELKSPENILNVKLFRTLKEIEMNYPELNSQRIRDYVRGRSRGTSKNTPLYKIWKYLQVEKLDKPRPVINISV